MAENLDDFLRRAAERRQQRNQQQRPVQQAAVQPDVPPPAPPRSLASSGSSNQSQAQRQVENKPKPNQQPKKKSNIQPQKRLAAQIEESDNRMDARLHKVFDHKLGQFNVHPTGSQGTATYSPKPDTKLVSTVEEGSLAKEVAEMFRNPESAKIAYIASEIFQRRF